MSTCRECKETKHAACDGSAIVEQGIEIVRVSCECAERGHVEVVPDRVACDADGRLDEVVMRDAFVHLEDLGDAYCLIVDSPVQHLNVTIPARKRAKAFIYEQYVKEAL